jgi:uncharacterized membrane protein
MDNRIPRRGNRSPSEARAAVSEQSLELEGVPLEPRILELTRETADAASEAGARARIVVYAATAAYASLFVAAAIVHYLVFKTARPDLGNMVQTIWTTLHGHFFETTTLTGRQTSRLGIHVDPFLVLMAPLYWLWSSPLLLVVFQALAVSSGALPVYWLARKHLGSERAAVHFALAYLLYPATQFNAFTVTSSFHAVAIAVPLVLFAIWFLDENRLVPFAFFALLAATTKEEIPLAVGCLGIWYAVRKGRRLAGGTIFALGLSLTLFNFLWVIPHFSPSGINPFVGRYQDVGTTPGGMVHKLFTDPAAFLQTAATGHKALYLVLLLAPFLGLWLLEPLLLLGAIPDLTINLLSSKTDQTSIPFHWTAAIIPFVVAASIVGAARFKGQVVRVSLYALVGCTAIAIFSPIYFLNGDVQELSSPLRAVKAHAVDLIPPGAPVSASSQLGGHLSERRYSYSFPYVRRARWIIVDRNDETYGDMAGFRRYIRRYESDPRWRTVFSSRGISVLRKRGDGTR